MQSTFVLIETRHGARITVVIHLYPTIWRQLVSVCSKICYHSLRFYLLSICFPSVCLPDTIRSWCPWPVAREEDRLLTLPPLPWSCSPPLTWVLSKKPVHFAYQAENYFLVVLGSFAWVLLHAGSDQLVKPILSCWNTVARHGFRGEQEVAEVGSFVACSQQKRGVRLAQPRCFPTSLLHFHLAPCPCFLCRTLLEKEISFFLENFSLSYKSYRKWKVVETYKKIRESKIK